jgi:hypothetical protein
MKPFSPFYEIPKGAQVRVKRTKPEDKETRSEGYLTETTKLPSGISLTFDLPLENPRFLDDFLIQDLFHLNSYIGDNLGRYYKVYGNTIGDAACDALELIYEIIIQRLGDGALITEIPHEEWARHRPTIKQVMKEAPPKLPSKTDGNDSSVNIMVDKKRELIQDWELVIDVLLYDIELIMGKPLAPSLCSAIGTAILSNNALLGNAFEGRTKTSPLGTSPVPPTQIKTHWKKMYGSTDRKSSRAKVKSHDPSGPATKEPTKSSRNSGSKISNREHTTPKKPISGRPRMNTHLPKPTASADPRGLYSNSSSSNHRAQFGAPHDQELLQLAAELEAIVAK